MSSYKKVTASQLHGLGGAHYRLTLLHKQREKELLSIEETGSGYTLCLEDCETEERREYCRESDDIFYLDMTAKPFMLKVLFLVFGNTVKITRDSWAYNHYAIPLTNETIMDSFKGIVGTGPGTEYYLYDEQKALERTAEIKATQNKFMMRPHDNITAGFELETQSTSGYTAKDMYYLSKEHDMNEAKRNLTNWVHFAEQCAGSEEFKEATKTRFTWKNFLDVNNIKKWEDLVEQGFMERGALTLISDLFYDHFDLNDSSEYEDEDPDDVCDEFLTKYFNINNVEVVTDESVDGFEFRTIGGLKPSEFQTALKDVFTLRHEIDTRCSFHIHLKVGDIKHTFDRGLRQSMIQFLFMNSDRLPESVRDRWSNSNANYFFEPDQGSDKFNFINFHKRNSTIEFRCFGNLNHFEDAMICLNLAIDALRYGYSQNDLSYISDSKWNDKAKEAMEEGDTESLYEFAKNHEENLKIIKANKILSDSILETATKIKTINL